MNKYLEGQILYGDNFTTEEIENWYNQEKEAYADLGSKNSDTYIYYYHALNYAHGFKYLKGKRFEHALGLGAAWGHEFYPFINTIDNLHIIEPSDNLRSDKIGNLKPIYTVPNVSGTIPYKDDFFDLVTSLGTLHHIPNVSFIFSELYRVTKKGGYILIREPIISMGDWNYPRTGLTRNERGIPIPFFRKMIAEHSLELINEGFCFTMTAFFQRKWVKFFKVPIYKYKTYVLFDKLLSKIFTFNLRYHATRPLQRIAPQSVFYVLKKI